MKPNPEQVQAVLHLFDTQTPLPMICRKTGLSRAEVQRIRQGCKRLNPHGGRKYAHKHQVQSKGLV